jgi:hypothetical protein
MDSDKVTAALDPMNPAREAEVVFNPRTVDESLRGCHKWLSLSDAVLRTRIAMKRTPNRARSKMLTKRRCGIPGSGRPRTTRKALDRKVIPSGPKFPGNPARNTQNPSRIFFVSSIQTRCTSSIHTSRVASVPRIVAAAKKRFASRLLELEQIKD